MEDNLLTPNEVAEILKINVLTLANWRTQGKHLRFSKIGRSVRYRSSEVMNFVKRRERDHAFNLLEERADHG